MHIQFKPQPIVALLAVGVVFGIVFLLNRPTATAAQVTVTPVVITMPTGVPTSAAGMNSASNRVRTTAVKATGNLASASQANIAFLIGGRVKELKVKEGDRVKAGAVLVTLDSTMLELQLAQAQAALDLAKANYDRIKTGPTQDDAVIAKSNLDRAKAAMDQAQNAFDRAGGTNNPMIGMLPQSLALQQAISAYQAAAAGFNLTLNHPTDTELRVVTAQVAQAQAAVELAKQNLANATLTAPIDGTVVMLTPKVGEIVTPSVPVITLADLSKMQVVVNLDENSLAFVRTGQAVSLSLDVLVDKRLTGRVFKTGLVAATASGIVSVPVTVDIDPTDASIYPGLSAMVEFQTAP